MNALEVMDIAHDTVWTVVKMIFPVMMAAMVVGLLVAFFQALTQIQEVTLTFVPKILVVFFVLLFFTPYMGVILQTFTEDLFDKIANLSNSENIGHAGIIG